MRLTGRKLIEASAGNLGGREHGKRAYAALSVGNK
jgi:hypothetical protein